MKVSITRKINLQKYGGNQYESADFYMELDTIADADRLASSDFTNLNGELEDWIVDYIKHLPKQMELFKNAIPPKPDVPFVTAGEKKDLFPTQRKEIESKKYDKK